MENDKIALAAAALRTANPTLDHDAATALATAVIAAVNEPLPAPEPKSEPKSIPLTFETAGAWLEAHEQTEPESSWGEPADDEQRAAIAAVRAVPIGTTHEERLRNGATRERLLRKYLAMKASAA